MCRLSRWWRWCSRRGSLNHTPVFQVMFAWQNQEWSLPELPGVSGGAGERGYAAMKFDLKLDLREEKEGRLSGQLNYATALFDEATIRATGGISAGDAGGDGGGSEAGGSRDRPLSREERELLLEEWNETEAEYPEEAVHS